MHTHSLITKASAAFVGSGAPRCLLISPASAASTSFNVTNTVTAVNPGTCPANFLGSFTVGLDIERHEHARHHRQHRDADALERSRAHRSGHGQRGDRRGRASGQRASGTTFTERRESTFTINGTAATGTSKLTATLPNGGTCSADFASTGTLGAALIPGQATTTVADDHHGAGDHGAAGNDRGARDDGPRDDLGTHHDGGRSPATGLDSSAIVLVGALVAAVGGVVLLVAGRRRA